MKRTALITGSGRGIGRAIALRLAEDGFDIVVNYVSNKQAASETASAVKEKGVNCVVVQADVRNPAEVKRLRFEAERSLGKIDTLVNNAGVSGYGLLDTISDAEYDRITDVNIRGVFNLCREFYSPMVSAKFGRIINISSMWGLVGASLEVVYSATKAAVIGFTKALAKELAPSFVTVNAIAPGVIKTDMLNGFDAGVINELIAETPVGRIGNPEDVAEAASYLASLRSGFITGEVINVSGGFVI